jgi:hypothetical protein
MIPQDLGTKAGQRRPMDAAFRRALERQKNSPNGMRETAQELRQRASRMRDCSDRDLMLRLAAEFECRATDAERRRWLRQDQPHPK